MVKKEYQRFKGKGYSLNDLIHYIKGIEDVKMSTLETCKRNYYKLYTYTGVTCSVIRLCERHNLEIAQELNEHQKQPKLFTKRVNTLFDKPVVEESRQGKTLCLVCEVV